MITPARILIVDDEPNVRLVFRTALESIGHQVAEVEDGTRALEQLARSRYELVLLDLRMPVMDGMTTLGRLREMGSDVPVIIVTAHGSVPDAVEAMKRGAVDFLSKPINPEALRRVVAEVLQRHAEPASAPASAPVPAEPAPVTPKSQLAENLQRAKRAINSRRFEEAEIFLRQAIGLSNASAEAHNLLGVIHEMRNEHDASYREYKAALRADADHEPARNNMLRYYERVTFGSSQVPVDTGGA